MIPVSNGQLLEIAAGGYSEDYDRAEGADTAKWAGRVGVYFVDRVLAQVAGERRDDLTQTYVVVPSDIGRQVAIDDTLSLAIDGNASTRKVQRVEPHSTTGTYRLYLWDA